jgi:hypothetical protein
MVQVHARMVVSIRRLLWRCRNGVHVMNRILHASAQIRDAAGPIRNRAMLLDYMPDIVVTFPGIVGTLNLIENADAFGIPIVTINGVFTP